MPRQVACIAIPALLLAACGETVSTEEFVVVSGDEAVGELVAELHGRHVSINYFVDNNGRGPKIREQLELDPNGYPLGWTIEGESAFGAPVAEEYRYADGEACWTSQADEGCADADSPPMYIDNDASPWALGVYARALLAAPEHSIELVPAGRLVLNELGTVGVDADSPALTIYSLKGINLSPQVIALDDRGRLFAIVGDRGMTIRAGFESLQAAIRERVRDIEVAERNALHARLMHRYDSIMRIDNVHVFDSETGERSEPTSVEVKDGVIVNVGKPGDPIPGVIVDGAGGTLLPGLFDMHAHTSFESLLFHVAAGVTSTRDMGNDPALLADIMAKLDAGELAGPRITPAGLIEARTDYSVRIGIIAENVEDALAAVDWYADNGYHEIKIYNSMIADWVPPIIAEARRRGLGVTGHIPAFTTPDQMILAGYDSIAHVNQLMLGWLLEPGEDTRTALRLTAMKRARDLDLSSPAVQKTVGLMQEHHVSLDTTAIILERLMLSRAGEVQPGDRAYLDHMPIGYQRYRKRTFVPLESPAESDEYEQAFAAILDTIGMLHDNGIGLLIGTDDGTGFSVHRELELYVEAGITPAETLTIASLGAARYLGQDDRIGRIAPGMLADFFLVPGDPTEDISAVREIRMAMARGTVYFPEEIYEALAIVPFADQPVVTVLAEGTQ